MKRMPMKSKELWAASTCGRWWLPMLLIVLAALLVSRSAQAQSAAEPPALGSEVTLSSGPSPSPAVIGNTITCKWSAKVTGEPATRAECLTQKATYTWSVDALTFTAPNGTPVNEDKAKVTLTASGASATTKFIGSKAGTWRIVVRVRISYTGSECGGDWNNGDGVTGSASVEVKGFVLHPLDGDFFQQPGRVLITKQRADSYYTVNNTTRANKPAQSADRQVQITAHLPAAGKGTTIFFRVRDPDDASPYEANIDGDDNTDNSGAHLAPSLSANSAVAALATINDNEVAAAEVTLTIDGSSGNNYIVDASADSTFPTDGTQSTPVLVAWKRCYLEVNNMLQKGATIKNYIEISSGNSTVLPVDSTEDFAVGTTVVIFTNQAFVVPGTTPPQNSQTIVRQIQSIDTAANTITVAKIGVELPNFSGIKIADNDAVYEAPRNLIDQGFGAVTNGSDGGAFIEYVHPIESSHKVPKASILLTTGEMSLSPTAPIIFDSYSYSWFRAEPKLNVFQLLTAYRTNSPSEDSSTGGSTNFSGNVSGVFVARESGQLFEEGIVAHSVVHELGHQCEALQAGAHGHVDLEVDAPNINGDMNCIMSYKRPFDTGSVKFDIECYQSLRRASDPE